MVIDWSELSITLKMLTAERDDLLNKNDLKNALNIQNNITALNQQLRDWLIVKLCNHATVGKDYDL